MLEQHNLYREQHGACPMTYSTALEDHVIASSTFQTTCDIDIPSFSKIKLYGENIASVSGVPGGDFSRWDVAEGVKDWYCMQ